MLTRLQVRRGTALEWSSLNPLLLSGEIGLETDTQKLKVGDGVTLWNSLIYLVNASDIGVTIQGYSTILANTTASYTTSEQTKLTSIEAGAEVNVNADWGAVSGDAQILNKPVLSTVATTGAYSDLSGLPTLGTASATNITDYATSAQGTKADTALQPASIINFETTTQLNDRDIANRNRTNHTGTQLVSTISDFVSASQAIIDNTAFVFEGGDSSTNFYSITLDMGASA